MNNMTHNKRTRLSVEPLEDRTVPAYYGASGGESVAIGDVLSLPGPGPNNVIIANGPGEPGIVSVLNSSNQVMQSFYPFGVAYTKGIYVASGDVTGDGHDDIIVGTGAGTLGVVKVFEYIDGGLQLISTFLPFGATYSGGVDVAVGNVTGPVVTNTNNGNAAEIVAGTASIGTTVAVFGYNDTGAAPTYYKLRSFVAFPGEGTGVTVAVADIDTQTNSATDPEDHDYSSIVAGMAVGLPAVGIFNAQEPTVVTRAKYYAFNPLIPQYDHGVNVAAGDTDGQRGAQIYVNLRGTGIIRVFAGETSAILTTITTTYPPSYATMINMAVGGITNYAPAQDDDQDGVYYTRDLIVVAADMVNSQIPVLFVGKGNSPAGLNGSRAL